MFANACLIFKMFCNVICSFFFIFYVFSDLCEAFGKTLGTELLQGIEGRSAIQNLLQEGRRSKTTKTKNLAIWGTKELRKLKS